MVIIDSYSESWYLADQALADLYPHGKAIFDIPTMEFIWLADRPPHQMVIIDSYSESWYLADQVLADLHPPSYGNYRFLLWELISADQVLADLLTHRKGIFNIPTMELYMVGR